MSEALAASIAAINGSLGPLADDSQRLIAAKCRALMVGYETRWGEPDFEVLGVEELVQTDLYNPATQARSRTFTLAGKLDLSAVREGRRTLFDHKTTSEDIKDPAAVYWRQLVVEAQPSHYMLLQWLNGNKIDAAVWDVMRKPDIRPKEVSKKDRELAIRYGSYCGEKVSKESLDELVTTERENFELYEARLVNDCTVNRPEHYFQRRTVPRLDLELHEHAVEVWDYSQEIITARRLSRHPKNSGACITFGRPCVFLGICSGHDEATSDNWKSKTQVHRELEIAGDGRDVLTNSRLTTFKTCRRKHFYQYEMGIERVDADESEALFFGSLWHKSLEAYFETFKKGECNGHSTGFAGTELATANQAKI